MPNSTIAIASQTVSVTKALVPASDPGLFDLSIDGVVEQADASDGDGTGPVAVLPGVRTVSEVGGTGTALGDYASDISCIETVGRCILNPGIACLTDPVCDDAGAGDTCDLTPVAVASCTGCTSLAVPVPSVQSAIACTVTNTSSCAGVDCSGLDDACNAGVCNPSTGLCEAVPVPDGTACEDATVCNGAETCQAGTCQAGAPLVCDNADVCDGTETCDAVLGCQAGTPLVCDNGEFCDGSEGCDALAGCQPGTPPTCDDGVACTSDLCDEVNDVCANTPDDLLCDDGVACTVDTCTAIIGCQNAADDAFCDNGEFCDGAEVCNPAIGCQPGFAVVCPDDGFSCTEEFCDEIADQCEVDNLCQCGNGTLEPGEECDPPSGLEDCNNFIDDDGDGDVDCADPGNPNLGIDTCGNDCVVDLACQKILRDPARLIFGRNGRQDRSSSPASPSASHRANHLYAV